MEGGFPLLTPPLAMLEPCVGPMFVVVPSADKHVTALSVYFDISDHFQYPCDIWTQCITQTSVATTIAGVFAIFANKIDKITEQLEDVDKAKS